MDNLSSTNDHSAGHDEEERQPLTNGDNMIRRHPDYNRWKGYAKMFGIASLLVIILLFIIFPSGPKAKEQTQGLKGLPPGKKFGEDGHGYPPPEPPSREELGRSTWLLLHHMAAHFNTEPSPQQQEELNTFVKLLGKLYPCDECRKHFEEMIEISPPDTSSNAKFSLWLCERHNEVNRRLGKPEFPCELGPLKKRWGDCGCDSNSPTA